MNNLADKLSELDTNKKVTGWQISKVNEEYFVNVVLRSHPFTTEVHKKLCEAM